jgi:hypothetical protein
VELCKTVTFEYQIKILSPSIFHILCVSCFNGGISYLNIYDDKKRFGVNVHFALLMDVVRHNYKI